MFNEVVESLGRWSTFVVGSPEHAWLAIALGLGLLWGALRWGWGRSLPLPAGAGAGWLGWAAPLPRLLRYAGLALLLLALLRPQTARMGARSTVRALDVMLALDVSQSMTTEDIKPNRAEAAKAALKEYTAALEGDRSYENLEASLQSFLAREGIEGLVETFLTRYVFDRVWTLVEQHVELRTASESDTVAMSSAVEGGCRSQVQTLIEDLRSEGRFDGVDWFGPAGQALGNGIVATLEFRLSHPES